MPQARRPRGVMPRGPVRGSRRESGGRVREVAHLKLVNDPLRGGLLHGQVGQAENADGDSVGEQ
jgi:hypothetical protein